ncbi:hypothetical protein KPH14_010295 [Odynerus spinipes]|uniref:Uncharacterized protein n=1 Tax=Odynerus spinipes TaxID=1348599 RepID=A0AAD9VTN6_9HYME|nr:hypothetical protein KPH14_010295 [Odynerus spinipes]
MGFVELKTVVLCLGLLLAVVSAAPKVYHAEGDSAGEGNEHAESHGHAHSYHHFIGPVVGHHEEITWKDKHGDHYHDYRAHPKYKFSYGVEDHHTKDHHGQSEHRDGKEVEGEYHIHEPGGNVRTVKYHADPHGGFFAEVHNHGGNDHSGGTYGGHKHDVFVEQFVVALSVMACVGSSYAFPGHAHSFTHYHGPVEGHAQEVSVHGKHGQHIDYVAHPKYDFSYGVEDHHTGDYHGQKEHRDGKNVVGEYTVKEPGGNTRIVKYHVDPHGGFVAHVHNTGGNNHEGGTYGGHGHEHNGNGHGHGHGYRHY